MDTLLAIASRREIRRFADQPLPDDAVRRILEAGRVSGSAQNKQNWRFLVLERATRERCAECVFAPDNLLGAQLAVAIVATGRGPIAFDAGRAAQNMLLAAWNEGIGSVPNGIADREGIGPALGGLGEDEQVVIVLAFGWPENPVDPGRRGAEEWFARANRKPFDEVVENR